MGEAIRSERDKEKERKRNKALRRLNLKLFLIVGVAYVVGFAGALAVIYLLFELATMLAPDVLSQIPKEIVYSIKTALIILSIILLNHRISKW